jgi:hypothetical protein
MLTIVRNSETPDGLLHEVFKYMYHITKVSSCARDENENGSENFVKIVNLTCFVLTKKC